jgi:hypothetical protein
MSCLTVFSTAGNDCYCRRLYTVLHSCVSAAWCNPSSWLAALCKSFTTGLTWTRLRVLSNSTITCRQQNRQNAAVSVGVTW